MAVEVIVRPAGMSVIYGSATNSVLAVMDSAAALRFSPSGALHKRSGGGAAAASESPVGVSAAGSSTAGSAALSPSSSRNSSFYCVEHATAAADALTVLPPPPLVAMTGRSITAAPIMQLLPTTPHASGGEAILNFALIGFRPRQGSAAAAAAAAVRSCRVDADAAAVPPRHHNSKGALGVSLTAEVHAAAPGTLLMWVDVPALPTMRGPVRGVIVEGSESPTWRYDADSCMLEVELPATHATGGARTVVVSL